MQPAVRRTLLTAFLTATSMLVWPRAAVAQIKQPGAHPDYSVELEPHFVLQWVQAPDWHDDVGLGLGLRASIPFFHNGPIQKINNNMGITFGVDTAFYSDCDAHYWDHRREWYAWNGDCHGSDWNFPVAMQWNFWLTPAVSVFGEPGLTLSYETGTLEVPFGWHGCPDPGGCDIDDSHLHVEPVFWAGGRFLLGDTVSIMVRLGVPYVSVGVGILI
jgi:hypothetical protein